MANRDEELAEILEKINDIRRTALLTSDDLDSVVRLIKEELDRKKARQTGPAIGQTCWIAQVDHANSFIYDAVYFDLEICENIDVYPEKRFAEAELRAKELIVGVNKRRRELNEGKEFGDRQFYIVYLNNSEVGMWETLGSLHARGNAYPFGLFKDSADCKTCIHEFKDELEWFYKDYLPLMAELDDYDWADAPGWDGVSSDD